MTLGELLEELRVNILGDRSARVEGDTDLLWSDATLVRYINEAQRRFARHGLVLRDGTSPDASRVTLVAGRTHYTLHPSVLAVMSAKRDQDVSDLVRTGYSALQAFRQPDPQYFDPNAFATLPPGKPLAFSTDDYLGADDNDSLAAVTLRIYPEPTAAYAGNIIRLRVLRLPLENLVLDNLTATPEIPEDHHLEMLDWAAYLALRIVDHDAGNVARALEFRASFDANVQAARKQAMRKMFAPLHWGFGRNGFTWEP
jgi:hypothetical protein